MFHFKKINLFGFKSHQMLDNIRNLLIGMGLEVVDSVDECDLIIVLGGDGTILHQAKLAHQHQVPIMGINHGHLGFLADVDPEDDSLIEAMLKGHYIADKRQVLSCRLGGNHYYAINELMVSKSVPTRMIKYEVFVDDQFLYEQTADGMIVSTATGSSAYALSAGGQLLHPDVGAISLVPVCPNKITSCPLVIHETAQVEILLHEWKDSAATIAFDAVPIKEEGVRRIKVSVDDRRVTFLHPMHYDYYRTLQHKLNWEIAPSSRGSG